MIYEYAVDPVSFTSEDTVIFLLESFGREKGRMISELKKDAWVDLVRRFLHNAGLQDVARKRMIEALSILVKKQKAIYCRHQQVQEGPDWISMTQRAHNVWPYRGIMLEKYNGDDPQYLVRDIHLSNKPNWTVPPSMTVDREAAAMVGAVRDLLANAREVILVDRNFRLENQQGRSVDKYKNVLLAIILFLAKKPYGPSVSKLIYHIGDEYYNAANLKVKIDRYLRADLPAEFRLEFAFWPKNDLHDRFLLTDIGGIDCGIGLDEYAGTSERTVKFKRLSNADYSSEWSRFRQKMSHVVFP